MNRISLAAMACLLGGVGGSVMVPGVERRQARNFRSAGNQRQIRKGRKIQLSHGRIRQRGRVR